MIVMDGVIRLTLISRTYCHLCEDMAEAVTPLLDEYGIEMEVVDVDGDPELEARFGEFVPVLLAGNTELSRFRLDISKLRDYLGEIR